MDAVENIAPGLKSADIDRLYREQRLRLHRFLSRKVWIDSDIDDIVQDTFLMATRHGSKFRGDCKPETWLFGIAINVMRNHWKANKGTVELPEGFEFTDEVAEDPMDTLVRKQMLERVSAALSAMPDSFLEAMQLIVEDGLQYDEVAAKLGVPAGTVRSRVHRARARLKEGAR
jgi:RNA polymerase sigma factor (sigma-70 family)